MIPTCGAAQRIDSAHARAAHGVVAARVVGMRFEAGSIAWTIPTRRRSARALGALRAVDIPVVIAAGWIARTNDLAALLFAATG